MCTISLLVMLNEITKTSPDKCLIELMSETPFKCRISFQSHVTYGSSPSKEIAIQDAARNMLKHISNMKLNSNPATCSISSKSDSNANSKETFIKENSATCEISSKDSSANSKDTLNSVNNLKHFCFTKKLAQPCFEVLGGPVTMKNNSTVIVRCCVQNKICLGIGDNEDKAFEASASLMLQNLKQKMLNFNDSIPSTDDKELASCPTTQFLELSMSDDSTSTPNDSSMNTNNDSLNSISSSSSSNSPKPLIDGQEITEVTQKFYSRSKLIKGRGIPRSKQSSERLPVSNQHHAGQLLTFFTENEKMLELKKTSVTSLVTHPDPFSFIKDICAPGKVEYSVSKLSTEDKSCCVVLEIRTNEMGTMISDGENFKDARNNVSRKMLLFLKTLME